MTYRARAAYPYVDRDRDRAVSGLRAQLRELAAAEGAAPDWSTFHVAGPDQVIDLHGIVCYEWTAAVDAQLEEARYL